VAAVGQEQRRGSSVAGLSVAGRALAYAAVACGVRLVVRERLGKALQQWKGLASLIECGQSFGSRTVRLLDATVVREPGKTGSQWRDSLQPAAAHAGVPPRCLL
jgi:hypothetical protein